MKVLFIGNSHTYFNDMVQTFKETMELSSGQPCEVVMLAYSGRSLKWHSQEYFSVRFNLMYGGFDYCIVQQQAHPFPGYEETKEGLLPIFELCRACGTVPVLYMPWAEKRMPENQRKIEDAFCRLAEELDCPMANVGLVWEAFLAKHPEIELFWKDGEHAGPNGDLLIAAVLCKKIMELAGLKGEIRLPAYARDFLQGMSVDFKNPRIIEKKEQVLISLDPAVSNAIQEIVK